VPPVAYSFRMIFRLAGPLMALAMTLGIALPAAAQRPVTDRLAIDIGLVEIAGKPGGQSGDRFKLINRTDTAVDVSAFVEDLGTDARGDLVAVPRGSTDLPSAAAWVTVADDELTVPANGTATVDAKIVVPPGTKAGGYYASITFDVDDEGAPESRLTHAILVRIGGAGFAPAGRVVSIQMSTPSFSGRVPIEVTVENRGNLHAVGGGAIEIVDTFGSRLASVPIPTVVVLPGRQRVVRVVYDSPPVIARLKATAKVTFGNDESSATDAGYVLIWWLAAMLAAVLLLFAVSLVRIAGLAGPKARARRAARAPVRAPAPVPAPMPAPEPAPAAAEPGPKRKRRDRKKKDELVAVPAPVPQPLAPMPPLSPPGAAPVPPPIRPRHDESFWGPGDDETPAPRVRDEPEVEPVAVEEPVSPFDAWTLDDEEDLGEEMLDEEDEPISPAEGEAESDRDEEEDEFEEDERDEDEPDEEPDVEPRADDGPEPAGGERDEDEPEAAWPAAQPASPAARIVPSRPVPVVRPAGRKLSAPFPQSEPQSEPESEPESGRELRPQEAEPVDEPAPIRPAIRPAARMRDVQIAGLPPLREPAPLPDAHWGALPPDRPLDRPAGGSAMALRRAEVAIRMISGKPGETGAILDSGLDLLYSVRTDPSVVERVEQAFEETRNRRKLGPLALALFAVDSRAAPEALLDAFGTASKVVAERLRRAILACDPADIRPHRALIQALPQGRRDQLGL